MEEAVIGTIVSQALSLCANEAIKTLGSEATKQAFARLESFLKGRFGASAGAAKERGHSSEDERKLLKDRVEQPLAGLLDDCRSEPQLEEAVGASTRSLQAALAWMPVDMSPGSTGTNINNVTGGFITINTVSGGGRPRGKRNR